jgi:mRNA interferase HigB
MWIISPKALKLFAEAHPEAKRPLDAWRKAAEAAEWGGWGDLKRTFRSADRVGSCVVFDVGGNKYRLIGRVFFASHKLYVLKVMTHAEYDRAKWTSECRCHGPQPKRDDA